MAVFYIFLQKSGSENVPWKKLLPTFVDAQVDF